MNGFLIAILTCLVLTAAVVAATAQAASNSVCARPDGLAGDAVLTICTHERGMAPRPQPRLFLRVFPDGRADYERSPRASEDFRELVREEIRVTPAELNEIKCLGREPDLQTADSQYKAVHRGIDSSRQTTVTFRDAGREKRVVLNNYWPDRDDNVFHYPSSLNALMNRAQMIWERANGIVRAVPTITFCELMLNRTKYLGRRVSMHADLEHHASPTRDLKHVHINEFLHDPECDRAEMGSARTNEKIGIAYPVETTAAESVRSQIRKLRGGPYHSRARVLVTGRLVKGGSTPARYAYEFEIGEFRSIEPIILPYNGKLVNGWTYYDTFDHPGGPEIQLSSALEQRLHHAERIEWRYTGHALFATPGRRHIVFRVVYVTTQMIAPGRWNDTYTCEILEVK